MKQEKRPGFVLVQFWTAKETYRKLKWRKRRRGGSIGEIFNQKAEQVARETDQEYGPPPDDFK